MPIQLQESLAPSFEELVAHLLDGRESLRNLCDFMDVDECDTVCHIQSDCVTVVNPIRLTSDHRP
jgi:hypothetical protein